MALGRIIFSPICLMNRAVNPSSSGAELLFKLFNILLTSLLPMIVNLNLELIDELLSVFRILMVYYLFYLESYFLLISNQWFQNMNLIYLNNLYKMTSDTCHLYF